MIAKISFCRPLGKNQGRNHQGHMESTCEKSLDISGSQVAEPNGSDDIMVGGELSHDYLIDP